MSKVASQVRWLVGAFCLTIIVGFGHIQKCDPQQLFYVRKFQSNSKVNIVLLGDSRVLHGLDPEAFESAIPGSKCLNFGFAGLGYSRLYLEHVNALLTPPPSQRIVVMGIDASEFTQNCVDNSAFTNVAQMTTVERSQLSWLGPKLPGPDTILRGHEYLANGWIPLSAEPHDPGLTVRLYTEENPDAHFSETIFERLCDQVRAWRAQGVTVLALRMPTGLSMYQMECDLIGYDAPEIRRSLEEAGAVWLELPNSDITTTDGSHLSKDAALQVSATVAKTAARLAHR